MGTGWWHWMVALDGGTGEMTKIKREMDKGDREEDRDKEGD